MLTPPWPPLSHSGLPAGIFPPSKRGECFPPLLGSVTILHVPGAAVPLQPPRTGVPSPAPTAGPVCPAWDGSDALLAGHTSPMPKSSRQCPVPPSFGAFPSMLGFELNFGLFFGNLCHWQAGSCCHHLSNLQCPGAFNNPLLGSCGGPQTLCKPGGELSSQNPYQPPDVTLMICPKGCDTLWLSPGIPNGNATWGRGSSYP